MKNYLYKQLLPRHTAEDESILGGYVHDTLTVKENGLALETIDSFLGVRATALGEKLGGRIPRLTDGASAAEELEDQNLDILSRDPRLN